MICEIHQIEMLEVQGQHFCAECLAKNRREPVHYQNLGALTVLPVGVRNNRLDNFKKTVKGTEYGFISSLRKLLDDEQLADLQFKVLWLHSAHSEEVSHLLSGIVAERLIHRKSAAYLSLSTIAGIDYEMLKEQLLIGLSGKICCFDNVLDGLHAVSVYSYIFTRAFSEAFLNHRVIVLGSNMSVEQFLGKIPQLRSLFMNYQHIIKEIRVYGK